MTTPLEYAQALIAFDSVSARSNVDISDHVAAIVARLGFEVERIDYTDPRGVAKSNVIARRGTGSGGLAFFGHTDVVPADDWNCGDSRPFTPHVRDARLWGRGSSDMKGPISCFLAAAERTLAHNLREPLYLCFSADEETGMQGIKEVVARSQIFREMVRGGTRGIVCEPSKLAVIHAHKGGCGVTVRSRGIAAHSSTTRGINANWKMIPFLMEIKQLRDELEADPRWHNPEFQPPTMSMNIGINDHNPALNITAPESICKVYFRAMPGVSVDPVLDRIHAAASRHELEYHLDFRTPPFYIDPHSAFVQECLPFSQNSTSQTVSYGTDAAHLGELRRVVVCGPGDIAQAHTCDEFISLADLDLGAAVYTSMIERWCVA